MEKEMTLAEYQVAVQRTMPDLGSLQLNKIHMIMGMNSEFNELYLAPDDINRAEELTDINWYMNNYANLLGIDLVKEDFKFYNNYFYFALPKDNYMEMLQVEISILTDLEKKMFAYKKPIEVEQLQEQLILIAKRLNDCYAYFHSNPFVGMERNIAKLKARFPEKFNEHDANNRNLEKERKILSGEQN